MRKTHRRCTPTDTGSHAGNLLPPVPILWPPVVKLLAQHAAVRDSKNGPGDASIVLFVPLEKGVGGADCRKEVEEAPGRLDRQSPGDS